MFAAEDRANQEALDKRELEARLVAVTGSAGSPSTLAVSAVQGVAGGVHALWRSSFQRCNRGRDHAAYDGVGTSTPTQRLSSETTV